MRALDELTHGPLAIRSRVTGASGVRHARRAGRDHNAALHDANRPSPAGVRSGNMLPFRLTCAPRRS
ncbi:hypothetical protein SAMN05216276_100986 [Streptosporangium subroseum]|uniref:Uncharacterized protein n=1 Tax=Streptosporangium subroseum TaxID=106412 RepID=A0A239EDL6_9ACTN|nr:hypothetical protein SAMN05216276_100986 [Streptosporangium subroseum]